jgi:hypothetical protein
MILDLSEFDDCAILAIGGGDAFAQIISRDNPENFKINITDKKPRKKEILGGLFIQSYFLRPAIKKTHYNGKLANAYEMSIPTFRLNVPKFNELIKLLTERLECRRIQYSMTSDTYSVPKVGMLATHIENRVSDEKQVQEYEIKASKAITRQSEIEKELNENYRYPELVKHLNPQRDDQTFFNFTYLRNKRDYIKWFEFVNLELAWSVASVESHPGSPSKDFIYRPGVEYYRSKFEEANNLDIKAKHKWALDETFKEFPYLKGQYFTKLLPTAKK